MIKTRAVQNSNFSNHQDVMKTKQVSHSNLERKLLVGYICNHFSALALVIKPVWFFKGAVTLYDME